MKLWGASLVHVEGSLPGLLEEGSGLVLFPSSGARFALSTPPSYSFVTASATSLITLGNAPNPDGLRVPDLPGTLLPHPGQGTYLPCCGVN